ncbi:hypothetical protein [Brachyspira sp.]|uniref:hypothetical protein n=1 Tax=Brachyspira sp. TaxID=1977261 RepID=UPI0026080E65|nr:hypothetical protein [Brachyspira sp.]
MKKLGLMASIFNLTISANLYCFDLLDDFDDFIEDMIKLIMMIIMILAVVYFIKKVFKDVPNNSRNIKRSSRDDDYRRCRDDRSNRNNRRERVIEDNIQYEYDMRDYDRREKRIPNNNNIESIENDLRYEKVYELKPEYKLKDNKKG